MLTSGFDILVMGEVMVEAWGRVAMHPAPSSSASVEVLHRFLGGMAGNSAVALANLGCCCALVSCIGGNVCPEYLDRLDEKGVSIEHSEVVCGDSPAVFAFHDSEQCYLHYLYLGSEIGDPSPPVRLVERSHMILFAGGHQSAFRDAFVSVSSMAEKNKIMFSPSYALHSYPRNQLLALIATANILALNRYETEYLCNRLGIATPEITELGPEIFVQTQDVDGCTVYTGDTIFDVGAIPVDVDNPVGAGDAFNAGFAVGFLNQLPPRLCAQIGTTAASFVVNSATTQADFDLSQVERLWEAHFTPET